MGATGTLDGGGRTDVKVDDGGSDYSLSVSFWWGRRLAKEKYYKEH